MDKVEGVVAQIQGLSANKEDWKTLPSVLGDQYQQEPWDIQSIERILSQLDAGVHTIGFAHFLSIKARLLGSDADDEAYMGQTKRLLLDGDAEQLKFTRIKVQSICELFTVMCRKRNPLLGIKPLATGVAKVAPSPDHLTTLHHNLLQLSLLSKCMKPAMQLLERGVVRVDKEGMQPRDVLMYLYYGGMVLIAQKSFQRAFDVLQMSFTMPVHALHEIMVEIYKKYLLVSLIVHGDVSPLPKYTTPMLQRMLRSCCGPYHDFANQFSKNKAEDVATALAKHRTLFEEESNYGLAHQAYESVYGRNIQRLTQTFVTLSLSDIASEVGLPDADSARRKIIGMVEKGEISATFDQSKQMMSFDTARMPPAELLEKLTAQIKFTNELNLMLRDVDETISTSAPYLSKVAMHERQSRWGEPGAASDDMMDLGEKPPGFSASLGAR